VRNHCHGGIEPYGTYLEKETKSGIKSGRHVGTIHVQWLSLEPKPNVQMLSYNSCVLVQITRDKIIKWSESWGEETRAVWSARQRDGKNLPKKQKPQKRT